MSHASPLPSCAAGMPTAYDLSSVIAGGTNVGHNNLIPLGELDYLVKQMGHPRPCWGHPKKHEGSVAKEPHSKQLALWDDASGSWGLWAGGPLKD